MTYNYHTLYGIGYGKNPIVKVDTAAEWLHENNLGR
jgi:hypothetical protein